MLEDTEQIEATEATQDTLITAEANTEGSQSDVQEAGASEQQEAEGASTEENQPSEDEAAKAPDDYEFSMPEGVTIDDATLGDLKTLSKDLGLSQEQAQKIADLGVQQSQRWAEQQVEYAKQVREEWAEQVKVDKEIGGMSMDETLSTARQALKAYGTPELVNLLNETGLGNHPEMIRAFSRIGKTIGDDSVVPGGRNSNEPLDPAKRLYNNSELA
jgi:hypothetical protein